MLRGAEIVVGRPGQHLPDYDFVKVKKELEEEFDGEVTDENVVTYALYPHVYRDFRSFRDQYGPLDKLDTKTFLIGPDIAGETMVCFYDAYICANDKYDIFKNQNVFLR